MLSDSYGARKPGKPRMSVQRSSQALTENASGRVMYIFCISEEGLLGYAKVV